MSLEGIFFMSLSIEAIIVSVFLIFLLVNLAKLTREIRAVNEKILKAAEENAQAADEAKDYIGKIGKSVVDYLLVKIITTIRGKN